MNTIKIDQITIPCKAISELGASAAVLLAFLCEIHRKYERKNELLERGFFPCTRQELTDVIGMLRRQQENAIAELSDLKYIKVKANQPGFNGGIRLFRINKEILIELGYYKESSSFESAAKPILVSDASTTERVPKKEPIKRIVTSEPKVKKKNRSNDESYDLFSLFGEEEKPQEEITPVIEVTSAVPEVDASVSTMPASVLEDVQQPQQTTRQESVTQNLPEPEPVIEPMPVDQEIELQKDEQVVPESAVPESSPESELSQTSVDEELVMEESVDVNLSEFFPEQIETLPKVEEPLQVNESANKDQNKSTFFDDHNWITNPSNIIYHPQSQMQQQLAEKIHAILTKEIDIYSKCSDLLTILGIRAQLEYFDMHNLSKCGNEKIQQTIDALLNFARIAPTLSPIKLKFHQAILVEIIKFIIKGHNRSILSFEYRTESPQPRIELQKILTEHYSDYQFNINIV